MSREEVGFPKESGFPTKSRFSKISRTRLPFLELLYNAVYQPTKSVERFKIVSRFPPVFQVKRYTLYSSTFYRRLLFPLRSCATQSCFSDEEEEDRKVVEHDLREMQRLCWGKFMLSVEYISVRLCVPRGRK
ncbi:hypothetical protein QLX08_004170 [Tetragonisca angustula]|uniref:Uncharacterized protein n=1 Tax=Tetragonisca angustula TaxID=166442 RepID=A0AAW1A3E1_9HYME